MSLDAIVDGDAKLLMISSFLQGPLMLFGEYVRERDFPVLDWKAPYGTCFVEEITVMGRTLSEIEARFDTWNSPTKSGHIGWLCTDFFQDGVLGIDCADCVAGLATRHFDTGEHERLISRLPFASERQDQLPILVGIRDTDASGARPLFAVDSGRTSSTIYWSYVRESWSSSWGRWEARRKLKGNKKIELRLMLPEGEEVEIQAQVRADPSESALEFEESDRVAGILGMDFLRRWVPVFDFPKRELLLFRY